VRKKKYSIRGVIERGGERFLEGKGWHGWLSGRRDVGGLSKTFG